MSYTATSLCHFWNLQHGGKCLGLFQTFLQIYSSTGTFQFLIVVEALGTLSSYMPITMMLSFIHRVNTYSRSWVSAISLANCGTGMRNCLPHSHSWTLHYLDQLSRRPRNLPRNGVQRCKTLHGKHSALENMSTNAKRFLTPLSSWSYGWSCMGYRDCHWDWWCLYIFWSSAWWEWSKRAEGSQSDVLEARKRWTSFNMVERLYPTLSCPP